MDTLLSQLSATIKKISLQFSPENQGLSFLLVIGKVNQGKTSLLRQTSLQQSMFNHDNDVEIYYNEHGIIVKLNETWLHQSNSLLQHTLKQLNRCHPALRISGIVLCMDVQELFDTDPITRFNHHKAHLQLLQRFGQNLEYPLELSILFTKLDGLAGFCEFFQYENNLQKPLGFAYPNTVSEETISTAYIKPFDHLLETLSQDIIPKMHPVRSSVQRTLIREFPLQLASLRKGLQAFLEHIPRTLFHLHAVYFTSAKQGGTSHDRLNKKIQHEYALTVQDHFHQSVNFRAYFIEEAITGFQKHTKYYQPAIKFPQKSVLIMLGSMLGLSLIWLTYHHIQSSRLLDKASKELLMYESITRASNDSAPALYHLAEASTALDHITADSLSLPTIQHLKTNLHLNTEKHLKGQFLPEILKEIELVMSDPHQSHPARYEALKIYLMLGNPQTFERTQVIDWFQKQWQGQATELMQKKASLLNRVLRQPMQMIPLNHGLISDTRNYLNALPVGYLYYALIKSHFPKETETIKANGFQLLAKEIPIYFTKSGFSQIMRQISNESLTLQQENWILERQDLNQLETILQQAYCYDYRYWWERFIKHTALLQAQDYEQAKQLAQLLKNDTIETLVQFIQTQTSPEFNHKHAELFNREIASHFTELNLLNQSAIHDIQFQISELEQFLGMLSVIHDNGKTAFTLTKSQFSGDKMTNPLSTLYRRAKTLPEPVASWTTELSDNVIVLLLQDSRTYINHQWQTMVLPFYQTRIAHRYPFNEAATQDIVMADFNDFFSPNGLLNRFSNDYLKPFLDLSNPAWQAKSFHDYQLPISANTLDEFIRANIITNMFFPNQQENCQIEFTLQKISLDPIIAAFQLTLGQHRLFDDQHSESKVYFSWPESHAALKLRSIEGHRYTLEETGTWAFFKLLQKVNVLVDEKDSANLQILFEINGNSGRYILKTKHRMNPFTPGILNGFELPDQIV